MMKMSLFGVMILWAAMGFAQGEYHIKNFGVTDELKVRGSTCLAQVNGFMWIGTSTGLVGFDGTHAYVYTIPDEDNRGGYYSRVTAIAPDSSDQFWVGSRRGIYLFEMMTQRLVHFKAKGMPESPNVSALHFDGEGHLWAILDGQAYVIDVVKKKAECVGGGLVSPSCLSVTHDGTVWLGDRDGTLYRYDLPNRRLRSYVVKPEGMERFGNIVSVTEMGDGQLALLSGEDGLVLFSPKQFTSRLLLTKDDQGKRLIGHTAITPDGENLWIGTENGIVIFRLRDGRLTGIRESRHSMNSLSDNAVHSLCADDDNGVWAGTFFGGMNRISLSPQNFTVTMPEGEDEEVGVVREICADNQRHLWVGTEDGGLYLYDREFAKLTLATVDWGAALAPFNVQGLMVVDDELWVSTILNGIYVVDTKTMQLKKRFERTNPSRTGQNIGGVSMCEQNGTIFVASSSAGVYIFDEETETFNLMPEMRGLIAHHLCADRAGNVWLATRDKGLWKIEQQRDGTWKGKQTSFSYKGTNVVMEDSRGLFWVGTDIHGLMYYNDETGETGQLDVSERLKHQSVNSIVEDYHHRLWIGTFDGLYSYNLEKRVMNHSMVVNGLPSDYMNYSASFLDREGNVYVGTYKGLVSFNPSTFVLSRERLKPYFLDLEVNGMHIMPGDSTGILKQTLFMTKELSLTRAQNTFTLTYAVPKYSNSEVIWYRYRLNPDEPWVVTDQTRSLHLTNLSTGTYRITLQASYNPDIWEGEPAVLIVTVASPGWLSSGAILSYVASIIFIVVIVMSLIQRGKKSDRKLLLF